VVIVMMKTLRRLTLALLVLAPGTAWSQFAIGPGAQPPQWLLSQPNTWTAAQTFNVASGTVATFKTGAASQQIDVSFLPTYNEMLFKSNTPNGNVLVLQNTSTTNSFAGLSLIDQAGKYTGTFGYANPVGCSYTGAGGVSFCGSTYIEHSDFPSTGSVAPDFDIISTGTVGGAYAVRAQVRFKGNGDVWFYDTAGTIRTYFDASLGYWGIRTTTTAVAPLDVVGRIVSGNATVSRGVGLVGGLSVVDTGTTCTAQLISSGIVQACLLIAGTNSSATNRRMDVVDKDNSSVIPLSIQLNGTGRVSAKLLNLNTSTTPASAAAACTAGDVAWDASFLYSCVGTNTWKRVAVATW